MRRLTVALGAAVFLGMLTAPAHAMSPSQHATAVSGGTERFTAQPSEPTGIAYLPATVNLQPSASGAWVNSGLQVVLPEAGTYALDANVHGRIWGDPPVNVVILARLVNVTAGRVLPNSTRLIDHLVDNNAGAASVGIRMTAPISERITVSGPTLIRLQATRINQRGASTIAEILSSPSGFTSLRYERISH